ncbi:hypothetical protein OkiPb01551_17700 [Bordetella pertussis]
MEQTATQGESVAVKTRAGRSGVSSDSTRGATGKEASVMGNSLASGPRPGSDIPAAGAAKQNAPPGGAFRDTGERLRRLA